MADPTTAHSPPTDRADAAAVDQQHVDQQQAESGDEDRGFLPTDPGRLRFESVFVRLIATAGIVGVGTAVGAILGANDVASWIISLVASTLSVVLAAVLWRSRRL
jgi:hypothetical protein